MSQHDMDIANAAGATVRADITAALKALASSSAGNSAPTTAYTGQIWIDTNTPSSTEWTLFIYDGTNWIDAFHIDITANTVEPTIGDALALHANGFVFAADSNTGMYNSAADVIAVKLGGIDKMYFQAAAITIGSTDTTPHTNSGNNPGSGQVPGGAFLIAANAETVAYFNRTSSDGTIIAFMQDGTAEGTIDVSGTTITYNAFAGAHWSQFAAAAKPAIPRGTVMSTIPALCEWKALEFTTRPRVARLRSVPRWQDEATEEEVEVFDRKGGDFRPHKETREIKRRKRVFDLVPEYEPGSSKHVLYDGLAAVGETIEYDHGGELVQATVVLEKNDRLPRCKVSDVAGDRAVYGVFNGYDGDGDVSVMALGAFVVRVAKGQSPRIGDLLESDGAGCARVQADDIVRASTVAKVTSTTPAETFDDGSYLLPCTLMCG